MPKNLDKYIQRFVLVNKTTKSKENKKKKKKLKTNEKEKEKKEKKKKNHVWGKGVQTFQKSHTFTN